MPPWRAWPNVYKEVSEAADFHIIVATGFYREIELNTYFVKTPYDQIWPLVRSASVQELTDLCVREIVEGIHGTDLRAGCIKLGTSQPAMTEAEIKTFRAGARAWAQTGAYITTHCTRIGAETSQLRVLDEEGTDLTRVVIGHTAAHLMNPDCRKVCLQWMNRGANFMPTNLGIGKDGGKHWQPLVDAIHEVFDAGHGDKLVLGLDSGYCSESKEFGPMTFLPPDPFAHMFTHTLPAFRSMGLKPEEEEAMMKTNPQRILPVQ
jgi:phosphotriesterase-related protein